MAPEPSVAGWGLAISTIMLSMISCEMCAPNAWVPRAQQVHGEHKHGGTSHTWRPRLAAVKHWARGLVYALNPCSPSKLASPWVA